MTEKTLKDIEDKLLEEGKGQSFLVGFSKIRQEAIKWIKEDIKALRKQGMVAKNIIAWDLLREWMKRLNITEADLE